jgi:hypothetical protein
MLGYAHAYADCVQILQYLDAEHGGSRKTGESDEVHIILLNGIMPRADQRRGSPYHSELIASTSGKRQM